MRTFVCVDGESNQYCCTCTESYLAFLRCETITENAKHELEKLCGTCIHRECITYLEKEGLQPISISGRADGMHACIYIVNYDTLYACIRHGLIAWGYNIIPLGLIYYIIG